MQCVPILAVAVRSGAFADCVQSLVKLSLQIHEVFLAGPGVMLRGRRSGPVDEKLGSRTVRCRGQLQQIISIQVIEARVIVQILRNLDAETVERVDERLGRVGIQADEMIEGHGVLHDGLQQVPAVLTVLACHLWHFTERNPCFRIFQQKRQSLLITFGDTRPNRIQAISIGTINGIL